MVDCEVREVSGYSHPFVSGRTLIAFALIAMVFVGSVAVMCADDSDATLPDIVEVVTTSGTCGENLSWTFDYDTNTLTITGYGDMTDYTANSERWGGNTVHNVVLPSGLTHIGDNAFLGCSSLTSITIPDSVTSIGDSAFFECTSLTSLTIPDSVIQIDGLAFSGCTSLESIVISDSVTQIERFTFYGCTSLESIVISDSVTSIGDSAFYGCTSLRSIALPDSVTSIGEVAFRECTSLESVTIPDSVTSISNFAFCGCTSLTSINVGESNTTYASENGVLFNKNKTVLIQYPAGKTDESYVIPTTVNSIANDAFRECTSLESVTIPESVTQIEEAAFFECVSLTSINVVESNMTYASENGVLFNKDQTILVNYPMGKMGGSYVIPATVTSIAYYAFSGCTSLTSLTIPDSVTSIGVFTFRDMEFYLDDTRVSSNAENLAGRTWIGTGDGKLYAYTSTRYVVTFDPNGGSSSVTEMVTGADGTLAELPDATRDGYVLTGWYSDTVGGERFDTSTVFTTDTVAYAQWIAGGECGDGLIWRYESGTLTIVYTGTGTGEMISWSSAENVPWNSHRGDITGVLIGNGVATVGKYAFSGCIALTNVTIPDSVTSISAYAFSGCSSLITLDIPYPVASIGGRVFSECTSLTNITIPDSVTSIPMYAFYSCTSLESIVIPESVTSIGSNAFYHCISLTSITIPDSVTSIGNNAFSGIEFYLNGTQADATAENIAGKRWTGVGDGKLHCNTYQWYTVTFDPNGGTCSITEAITCRDGTLDSLPDAALDNYIFMGWFKSADSWEMVTTDTYIPSDITVYARWMQSSECGDGLVWTFSKGTLSIDYTGSGTGVMTDYDAYKTPWYPLQSVIKEIIVGDGVKSIGSFAFYLLAFTEIAMPDSVTSIGYCSFLGCRSLTSIEIPCSVVHIDGDYPFDACSSLTSIVVEETNPAYMSYDGILFSKDMTELIKYPEAKAGSEYVIPSTVTSVGSNAFGNPELVSIIVPYGVTNLGYSAFGNCSSLTSMVLPETVVTAGREVFIFCNSLTTVDLGKVTCYTDSWFSYCSSLETILVDESNTDYSSEDGILFNKTKSTLVYYPHGKTESTYVIPDTVDEIWYEAFMGCERLTNIVLPDTLMTIQPHAFNGCCSLTEVIFPEHVETIDLWAFANCDSLESVTIPSSVGYLAYGAFSGCDALTSVSIQDGLSSIDSETFSRCPSLTYLYIPSSVTQISDNAFTGITFYVGDAEVEVNAGNLSGGTWVGAGDGKLYRTLVVTFDPNGGNCSSTEMETGAGGTLASLPEAILDGRFFVGWFTSAEGGEQISTETVFASDATVFAHWAVGGICGDGVQWMYDDGVLTITSTGTGTGAMVQWSIPSNVPWHTYRETIRAMVIGEGVTTIGSYAFSECTALTTVILPNTLTSIGSFAFSECTFLASVTLPESVTSISNGVFYGCVSLVSIEVAGENTVYSSDNGVLFNREKTQLIQYPIGKGDTSYTIPDSVTYIGPSAFSGCIHLSTVAIPNTVMYIGENAFSRSVSLVSIEVGGGNTAYCSDNGVLFNKDRTKLIQYPIGKEDTSYTIPDSVTSIGGSAFSGCIHLSTVVIPNSVMAIGYQAFEECTSLSSVAIPDSVRSIGINAFSYCTSITSAVIGNSVTSISNSMFSRCTSLVDVVIGNSVTSIDDYAFYGCTSLASVTIPDSVTTIGHAAFNGCNLERIEFGTGIENIAVDAFSQRFYDYDGTTVLEANADNLRGKVFVLENGRLVHNIRVVEVSSSDDTAGAVQGEGLYEKGTTVTISATPNAGHKFSGWYSGGVFISSEAAYSFTVAGNVKFIAYFDKLTIVRTDSINAGIVDNGTAFSDLGLPSYVTCYDENGNSIALPVVWSSSDYDPTYAGTQVIGGTVSFAPYAAEPGLGAVAYVTVRPAPVVTMTIITDIRVSDATVSYGTPASAAAISVEGLYDGGSIGLSTVWSTSSFDPYAVGGQQITGTVYLPYGHVLADGLSSSVTATITVTAARIVSFVSPDMGLLPAGTSVDALGLPMTIGATLSDGTVRFVPVSWNEEEFVPDAGTHTIAGEATVPAGYVLDGISSQVIASYTLVDGMIGFADIVFVVDTTGSMYDEISNVRRNISAFASQLESTGISVRWALVEYRDITCDGVRSTRIILNGSENWYIDADAFSVAIGRLSVDGGGDRPETVIDALELSRTLESRNGAYRFFIVVTDADYKVNNQYGVSDMDEEISLLVADSIHVSVVTHTSFYSVYRPLADTTGGILANIEGSFRNELMKIADTIGSIMVDGELSSIRIATYPYKTTYNVGESFDGTGMVVEAVFATGAERTIQGYSVDLWAPLKLSDSQVVVNYRGCTATVPITVRSNDIPVTGVTLSRHSVEGTVGGTYSLTASIAPSDATLRSVIWTTSNKNIVTVDSGRLSFRGVGEAQITVTTADGRYTDFCTVTVNAAYVPAEDITLDRGAVLLRIGGSEQLNAVVTPFDATDKTLTWSVSDDTIISVINGEVTGLAAGFATVTVTDSAGHSAYCLVKVQPTVYYTHDGANLWEPESYDVGSTVTLHPVPEIEGYDVSGWYTEGLTIVDGTFVISNYDVTIPLIAEIKSFDVAWYGEDGSLISERSVNYGTEVSEPVDVPIKESTVQYDYSFSGWRYEDGTPVSFPVTVCGDTAFYASFVASVRDYTITFTVDGAVYSQSEQKYGSDVSFPADPTKAKTSTVTYTFSSWNPSDTVVSGDMIFNAVFSESNTVYDVSYYIDGVLHERVSAAWGSEVALIAVPDVYGYEVSAWDCGTLEVSEGRFTMPVHDVDINATKTQTLFTVRYYSEDKLFATERVGLGSSFPVLIPAKTKDVQYSYVFDHWEDASGTVYDSTSVIEADLDVYADYSRTINSYPVIFLDYDGSVWYMYYANYGSTVVLPGSPADRSDSRHTVVFSHWEGYTDGMTVTGRMTFSAIYTSAPIYRNVTYTVNGSEYVTDRYIAGDTVTVRERYTETGYVATAWQSSDVDISTGVFVMPAADVTISCTVQVMDCTLVFMNGDEEYATLTAGYGSVLPIPAGVPTKASDGRYDYAFLRWVDDAGAPAEDTTVTCDAVYYAVYSSSDVRVLLMFMNGDEVYAFYVLYYGMIKVSPSVDPERDDTPLYSYQFSGWNSSADGSGDVFAESAIVSDETYYAMFDESNRQFSVRYVSGGTVLYTESHAWGSEVTVRDVPDTIGYTSMWTSDLDIAAGSFTMPARDVTITLVSTTDTYGIRFSNYDGAVLYEGRLAYGSVMPTVTAVRESTVQYNYAFTGWMDVDGALVTVPATVTGPLDVTAVFDEVLRPYRIVFYDSDGTTIISSGMQRYGTEVVLPADPPQRSDSVYTYTFSHWDGYTEGMTVTGRMSFVAAYDRNLVIEPVNNRVVIDASSDPYVSFSDEDIATLVSYAQQSDSFTLTVKVMWGTAVFDAQAVRTFVKGNDFSMMKIDASGESESIRRLVGTGTIYEIYFGTNRNFGDGTVTLTLPYTPGPDDDLSDLVIEYLVDGRIAEELPCVYDSGRVTFVTSHFSTYAIVPLNTVSHVWSAVYDWSEDCRNCVVHMICADYAGHNRDIEATVTSAVKAAATYSAMGITSYAVSGVFNGFAYSDTRDVQDIAYIPRESNGTKVYEDTLPTNAAADVTDIFDSAKTDGGYVEFVADTDAGKLRIEFDSSAVGSIGGNDVSIKATVTEGSTEAPEAEKVIEVTLDGATFASGRARVSLPLPEGVPDGKIVKVYFVNGADREDMNAVYSDGMVTFETNHFSSYAIVFEDAPSSGSEFPIAIAVGGGIGALALAGVAIILLRRRS